MRKPSINGKIPFVIGKDYADQWRCHGDMGGGNFWRKMVLGFLKVEVEMNGILLSSS